MARQARGYETGAEAARAMGVSEVTYTSHENGHRGFDRSAARYATFFGVSLDWLLEGRGAAPAGVSEAPRPYRPPSSDLARDVPVHGTVAGAVTGHGAFQLTSDVVDYVRRPPILLGVRDAYALYVEGDSMSPRFEQGDIVFVHPHRPLRAGDYVIIQCRNHEKDRVEAYIKRFEKRTATHLVVTQFNPSATIEFDLRVVIAAHKVLTNNDLFGV